MSLASPAYFEIIDFIAAGTTPEALPNFILRPRPEDDAGYSHQSDAFFKRSGDIHGTEPDKLRVAALGDSPSRSRVQLDLRPQLAVLQPAA